MQFFSRGMRYLKQQHSSEHIAVSSYNILIVGLLGTIGHPIYWLWRPYIAPQLNENLLMRIIGLLMCALLLLHQRWPVGLKRFLPTYYFLTVAYTLPFFFVYYLLLSSHYSIIWVIAEIAMVFLSMLVLPSLIVWVLNLAFGLACAILCANFFAPHGINVDASLFLYVYFPIFVFSAALGIILNHSHITSVEIKAKTKVLQALASSISDDMHGFLGKIKFNLDRIKPPFPILRDEKQTTALPSQQLNDSYQNAVMGDCAINRGSQNMSMIADEVKSTPIETSHFVYLQAAQTTQKAMDEYAYENIDERHKIHIEVKNDFIFKGDEALYLAILFNLIKTALCGFHFKSSATLTITIDQPTITVRDTGPGMPANQLSHLFDTCSTKDKENNIELAYSKRVMLAFCGDITCRSTVGQFTEFVLRFPEVQQSTWVAYEQSLLGQMRPYFKDKRILVVDDDETLRMMTQSTLSNLGAHSDEAEHGQLALWQLTQAMYDAVVMDLSMPVLDGYAAAEKIRAGAVPGYEKIPIIAYTTDNAYMAQVKAKKVGIDYFANKSFGCLTLIQAVAQALKASTAMGKNDKPISKTELIDKAARVADDSETNKEKVVEGKDSAPLPPLLAASELSLFDLPRLTTCKERGLFKQGENSAYCRQSKEWLVILETSIVQRDFQKMKDALHFLKGSSANVGAQALSELVANIDKQATENNWPHEEGWFEKIKSIHARTLSALLLYCL